METRILIADDNRPVREGLRKLLSRHAGWEVCGEATDGCDAVRKAEQVCPDVVVLDFSMPGMNGVEAARRIAKASPSTAVLLCSMFLDSSLARMARAAGILGAVSKSNVKQLVAAVEAVLRGETFFASRI